MKKFQFFAKSFAGISFFIAVLFIAAGRIDWYQGWVYAAISLTGMLMNFVSINNDSELMEERSKPGKNTKKWDKQLLGASALLTLITFVVAGLDTGRYHWSPRLPWYYCMAGATVMFIGQLLFLLAKNHNRFFSSVARIQTERNHTVCDTGLYKSVRHPGYLGMIISLIGFPILTNSLFCAIPTIAAVLLLLLRTSLEDSMLIVELNGYADYTKTTRFRLLPYIW
jgi:protein-S-isoprenylcysteine O-methyltransferase Ste14